MMKNKNQKTNWLLDFTIFAAFLLLFFLELTGVAIHQWLGLVVFLLIVVHLILHLNWVRCALTNFFGKVSARMRVYALIDFLLMFGMVMIFETGLLISTWFNFNIGDFATLVDLHLYFSIGTLALTVLKIGLHSRWIVCMARRIFRPTGRSTATALQPEGTQTMSRRQFMTTMGLVTLGSAIAIANVWPVKKRIGSSVLADNSELIATQASTAAQTQATATQTQTTQSAVAATSAPQATATATTQPTAQAPVVCNYSCRRGNHCAYPGLCHDYRDINNNGLCDEGECA